MPTLTWANKQPFNEVPGSLAADSIIYPQAAGYPHAPLQNKLVLGDNLKVMSALLADYAGKIDLVYADPPFFTNRHFPARVGRGEDSRRPQEWQLAAGYPDQWPNLDAYLDMLYPRLQAMHRLLSPSGTLYLHLDWHANAYARLLLDEIFGPERLLNEIVWVYHGPSPIRSAFNRKHDTLLVYTKSDDYTFNVDDVRQPYDPSTVKTFASSPKAGFGKVPDLERGKVPEDWWYFPVVARLHNERTGYPTQKPQALLERIIRASSNPGGLVADFFGGSGTTAAAASLAGRRFISVDGAWRAVQTSLSRLVESTRQPFELLVERATPLPDAGALPGAQRPRLQDGQVILPEAWLENLDYWEIDPCYDGALFRSAAQATRPRRHTGPSLPLPDRLALPGGQRPAGQSLAVRLVQIDGARRQVTL